MANTGSSNKVKSVVWNGTTWSNSLNGAIDVSISGTSRPDEVYVGVNDLPTALYSGEETHVVTVTVLENDPSNMSSIGAKSDLVVTLSNDDGDQALTMDDMVLVGRDIGRVRNNLFGLVMTMQHESDDGSTDPLS